MVYTFMIAATLHLGTKGLRAFCQTFDRARALTSSCMALTAAVIMMRPPVNDLRKRSLRVRILGDPCSCNWAGVDLGGLPTIAGKNAMAQQPLWEKAGKGQRTGQFLPLRQFVDLQHDREIFLTQIGRLGLELMLQLAQVRLIGISGFR